MQHRVRQGQGRLFGLRGAREIRGEFSLDAVYSKPRYMNCRCLADGAGTRVVRRRSEAGRSEQKMV